MAGVVKRVVVVLGQVDRVSGVSESVVTNPEHQPRAFSCQNDPAFAHGQDSGEDRPRINCFGLGPTRPFVIAETDVVGEFPSRSDSADAHQSPVGDSGAG